MIEGSAGASNKGAEYEKLIKTTLGKRSKGVRLKGNGSPSERVLLGLLHGARPRAEETERQARKKPLAD